jgi:ribosomal protein S18 acetylase RimI-like enzyme
MDQSRLAQIEDAALNAWTAPRQMFYDGWLLRFTGGHSKRINSINSRYSSTLPLVEKIRHCEAIYAQAGLPVTFRLPAPFTPPELLDALDAAGYEPFDPTLVLGRMLEPSRPLRPELRMEQMPIVAWIALRGQITHTSPADLALHRAVLRLIVPEKVLVGVFFKDEPVACGMGVVEGDLLGYFSIYTASNYRRQGFGQAVMDVLTAWGLAKGASFGYLQVEGDNAPALNLYRRLHFETCYTYHYYREI